MLNFSRQTQIYDVTMWEETEDQVRASIGADDTQRFQISGVSPESPGVLQD